MHTAIMNQAWAMDPGHLATFLSNLDRWTGPESRTAKPSAGRTMASQSGGIAVIPLYGIVTQNGLDPFFGQSTSTTGFSQALNSVLQDDSVASIIIDINSPGGSVYGVMELADEVFQARGKKPIVAIANSLAASAAYWIGSQATEFYCVPSGETGSIGVWEVHQDFSQAMEKAGIKTTLISSTPQKVEMSPYQPLDPDAKSFAQSRVMDYHNTFIQAVARGRGVPVDTVRKGMGQGRILGAQAAKRANMVDGVKTMPQVINLARSGINPMGRKASTLANARAELSLMRTGTATPKLDKMRRDLDRLR